MKNKDLIRVLQSFDGDVEVTTSDKMGKFNDIDSVELQEWNSSDGDHASITLVLGRYDQSNTLVDKDRKFIKDVNNTLIDMDEAMCAKEVFEKDIQERYNEWFKKNYDKLARESMIELFGDDKILNNKMLVDLKLNVYENGWQDELDKDEFNDRDCIIRFLYGKLDKRIKEKISRDIDGVWKEVFNDSGYEPDRDSCRKCCCDECSNCDSIEDIFTLIERFNNRYN